MKLEKLITIEVFGTPDIKNWEVILATDHVEKYRGLFLLNRETCLVERRNWVSLELSEEVLMDYMEKMLCSQEIEKEAGHG